MAQSHPLITIGITCFNAQDTIIRAVKSALAQDWPNFEVIVIDDCSRDKSVNLLLQNFKDDPRVKIMMHEQNKGYPGALNTILSLADGEFVAFFDDDDESLPKRLSRQYERITFYEQKHKAKEVLCYSDRVVVKPDKESKMPAIGRIQKEPKGPMVADFLLWHREEAGYSWGQFGSCTLMARKEVFEKYDGFDEEFRRMAEWDFAIRFAQGGGHFIAVRTPLVRQYITPTEDKGGKIPLEYAFKLRQKHQEYLKEQGVYNASFMIARSRFHYSKGRKGQSRLFLALACLMAPFKILPNEWEKRRRRKAA